MILFTADWHIKLGQKNVPREWATDRYRKFFEQVHGLEKQCNMHIIGGDLFDRLPNMEELELYFEFISKVRTARTFLLSACLSTVTKSDSTILRKTGFASTTPT